MGVRSGCMRDASVRTCRIHQYLDYLINLHGFVDRTWPCLLVLDVDGASGSSASRMLKGRRRRWLERHTSSHMQGDDEI